MRKTAIMLLPVMENTAKNMFKQLGIEEHENLQTWESLKKYGELKQIQVIEKGEPLFMRLNTEEEIEYIKSSMKS